MKANLTVFVVTGITKPYKTVDQSKYWFKLIELTSIKKL